MLGRKTLVDAAGAPVDSVLPVSAVFQPIPAAGGPLECGFSVEEEEMLIDLELSITFSNTVVEPTDFTLFVDATDISAGVNGLYRLTPALANDENSVYFSTTRRLPQGFHTVEARVKAPTGVVTLQGASIPCEVVARRHSHPATLGHGVDSKVQLVQ